MWQRTWDTPDRRAVLGSRHLAAASHPAVTAAGNHVLASGGNAVDATLAMAAQCWLTLPGQCGIGGDAFAVVREPDGSVWTVGGSGFGPDGGEPSFYRDRGCTAVPLRGGLSVAVPGAPAALAALHARSATLPLDELWAPAIAAAERGVPCTAKTRADIAAHTELLAADSGTGAVFLPERRVPEVGTRLVQAELAQTMRILAADPGTFYKGELAEKAVAALRAADVPFSGDEWQLCGEPLVGGAISTRYGGVTVHQTPPPSAGWMMLQQAALSDGRLGEHPVLGADSVDLFAAAARRAFADRFAGCASDNDEWRRLLEPDTVRAARAEIAAGERAAPGDVRPDGDTTATVAVDAEGRAVSFIHSLAFTFGSGVTIPGTGVVLNNRLGRGAYLIDGHPNEVRPRRRPLHTLNAWIATDEQDRLRYVGNTPGGDGQVQWNTQLLSHLVDHGADAQQAVSAPRFTVHPGSDADTIGDEPELRCEDRLGDDVLTELRGRGHTVRAIGPWDAGGSALVLAADHAAGVLSGGADPRQDGVVLGD
ncbi:gamma-glutamyltransferase [Saccharomonospora sp. CUA-673]|uniref:gamma-glutamyltransferase family protein n=1 Tax=Saccharomonospora sp. CUA-673 TaxID=1904969 RepID=UPI00095F419A|nr:gamma-glutamyltransferase [Saccharomonospora sp. CUA-673]OLT40719.1 gamma-glutamyltransferase [Saccharomonospora sp. CUA-673]